MTSQEAEAGGPKVTWLAFFGAIILVTVVMMVVSFPAGLYTVFGTHISPNDTASTRITGINVDLVFAVVTLPVGGTLGDTFLVALALFFVFFILAWRQGAGLFGALRGANKTGEQALFTNPLSAITILLGAVSLVTIVLDNIQTSAGVATGSLTGDPFALLFDFTIAPLAEETTFRVIMIGIPIMLLTSIILRSFSPRKALKALWRPSSIWDTDETEEDSQVRTFKDSGPWLFAPGSSESLKVRVVRPMVYTFAILSSVAFGYAHYAAGSGWGPGKISEAAIAGLALAYLYIKYGFHADVLLHWGVNYVGSIFSFLAQGLFGIPWDSNTSSNFLDVFPTDEIVFLLGIPATLIVARELLRAWKGRQAAPDLI